MSEGISLSYSARVTLGCIVWGRAEGATWKILDPVMETLLILP